jgi:GDP-4-dehydro-6-deoxy-D-mannose reductase
MPTSALVTGAAGFAGGHLVELLAGDGVQVTAWHRPGGEPPLPVDGVRWLAVDLLDREAVRLAVRTTDADVVYHCAGAPHVGHSWRTTVSTFAINVRCTHNLVEALRAEGRAPRLVVASSALVYQASSTALTEDSLVRPASPYAVSKLAQELVALEDAGGQHVGIARSFNHFGPRQHPGFVAADFARRIADIEAGRFEPEIAVGNLQAQRDLTDVRDTVRAYRAIGERGQAGRVYNVCTGRTVVIRDLLEMLLARARVPITVRPDPARFRPIDQPIVLGDPTRLREELEWTPLIPIERTLDDLLAYWRERAAGGA